MSRIAELFLPARYFFRRHLEGRRIDAPPTFVLGSAGSGLALLLEALDRHPRIHAIREPTRLALLPALDQLALLEQLDRRTVAANKCRWVERSPEHVGQIGTLLVLAPEARLLFLTRDGRDVVHTLQKRGVEPDQAARRWVAAHAEVAAYRRHPQLLTLRLEELLDDPVATLVGVTNLLDERYDPQMAEVVTGREGRRLAEARGRWRAEFDLPTRQNVARVAGATLHELGYDSDPIESRDGSR